MWRGLYSVRAPASETLTFSETFHYRHLVYNICGHADHSDCSADNWFASSDSEVTHAPGIINKL